MPPSEPPDEEHEGLADLPVDPWGVRAPTADLIRRSLPLAPPGWEALPPEPLEVRSLAPTEDLVRFQVNTGDIVDDGEPEIAVDTPVPFLDMVPVPRAELARLQQSDREHARLEAELARAVDAARHAIEAGSALEVMLVCLASALPPRG